MKVLIEIIKTLLSKDTDKTEIDKPWYARRRYWGIVVMIISAIAYNHYGLVMGDDIKDMILNNIDVIINSIMAAISAFGFLYGLFLRLKGKRQYINKLKAAVCTPTPVGNAAQAATDPPIPVAIAGQTPTRDPLVDMKPHD